MKNMLGIAISIAAQAFENRVDKQNEPYILHCLHVMRRVDEKNRIPAVLHDYVEDIFEADLKAGLIHLRELGFDEDDVRVIDLLTHRKEDSYEDYIKKIATCPRATQIKLQDLRHNSNISRIKGALTKKHFDNIQKYHTAYQYLSKT